jgi:hypothetical protein
LRRRPSIFVECHSLGNQSDALGSFGRASGFVGEHRERAAMEIVWRHLTDSFPGK